MGIAMFFQLTYNDPAVSTKNQVRKEVRNPMRMLRPVNTQRSNPALRPWRRPARLLAMLPLFVAGVLLTVGLPTAASEETVSPTAALSSVLPANAPRFGRLVLHPTAWGEAHYVLSATPPCPPGRLCLLQAQSWQLVPSNPAAADQLKRMRGKTVLVIAQAAWPGAPGHAGTLLVAHINPGILPSKASPATGTIGPTNPGR